MTRTALLLAAALATLAAPALSQPAPLPPPTPAVPLRNGAEMSNGSATIRVTALTDSILRVRIARAGHFPEDASWAVPAEVRARSVRVEPLANGFETGALNVAINPETLALTVSDRHGRRIHADTPEPISFDGNAFTLRKAMPVGEQYYGLGDKTGPFNRRGASYVHWNTDAYGFDRGTDPIYKSIPFTIASGGPGGAYGLFLDNSWRSSFDFGHRDENLLRRQRTDRLLLDRGARDA